MITTFGEIMLRIYPESSGNRIVNADTFIIEPGGSASNVAIALSQLGNQTKFISSLPTNELSDKIEQYLRMHGVDSYLVKKGSRVGVYWTETGIGPRNSFVIYDRENSAFSEFQYDDIDWQRILRNTNWFHFSGISPALSESVCSLLERLVQNLKCSYSVDLNYRKKLWNWVEKDPDKIELIMTNLCKNATLISGNETDFSDIFGIQNSNNQDDDNYLQIAESAFRKFPNTKYISLSNRRSYSASRNDWNGYLFVIEDQETVCYKSMNYNIDNIVDRVGTGDCFLAGIIHGLINFDRAQYQKTVDFAATLAALNHTTRGDASYFSEEEVFRTMNNNGTGRIIR